MSPFGCLQSRILIAFAVMMFLGAGQLFGQTAEIGVEIQTENRVWSGSTATVMSGTITNLTDGPLDVEADPALYLSSRTSTELRGKFWAPVDLLHDSPIATKIRKAGKGEAIETIPVHLHFEAKNETIGFKVDARHLHWAREISSVWPDSPFFGIVTSDEYDLTLVLETPNGHAESPPLRITVDASSVMSQPQSFQAKLEVNPPGVIVKTMFPNAPEKTKNVDCFRSLKKGMPVEAVVQKCGRPDEEVGSGIYIFVWNLADGSTVSIGTPSLEKICEVRYTDPNGKISLLLHCK
jgi:hypothetical protein